MRERPRPLLPWWAALPVAVGAAFVYDLGFPGASIWSLAFAGIALALLTLIGRSIGGALLMGYVFGATFYLVDVSWTGRYLGPIPWLALSLFEAVFVAVGALAITLAYRWMPRAVPGCFGRLVALPALVAGLWVLRENVVGSVPYGGFPWARAALSQSESPFAQLVSWGGSSGLGFVMVFLVAAIIEWVRARSWSDWRGALPVAATLVVALLLPAWPTTPNGELRVASAQGNGPAGYFDEREPGEIFRSQLEASEPLFDADDIDVLLWPEGSVDLDPLGNPSAAAALDRIAEQVDAPFIMNAVSYRDEKYYNTSMLWRAGEGATAFYDKRNPVPFGEYIPDRDFYMFFAPDLISLVQRGYSAGTNPPVFDLDGTLAGLAICFDVIYDGLIWEGARDGAEVYLLQTNNADFRGTDENLQQLAIARLRAIETGRSVVNLSTVGTSQVMDPTGRTIDGLRADVPGAMLTDVELRTGLTPAVFLGPWVPGAIGVLSFAGLIAAGFAARRRRG
ncbi:apolipoprotein N-acyltransferase [Agromyces sp. NPDC060279]|uniref:apolipoprotein N-acyltransferase n=1 Tax=Agromyces sp. NPDC060279 TaxID=3347092 RepID=UPI00364CF2EF